MLEIERIVQAKLDNGQRVEDLERDFDKLVLECLPALVTRNRRAEPPCAHRMLRLMKSTEWTPVSCLSDSKGSLGNSPVRTKEGSPRWEARKRLGVPGAYPH